ncbi:MAG: phosphoribosyl-AMP cyclohydrolase [Alphaproteobacteria bacterium]|nr:phosphoribosyl-AMP cyclohydrolase [Alphaproteobacteria bacterium]
MTDTLSRDGFLAEVRFGDNGLIPVVAQNCASGQVLMVAWMNREVLEETLDTGHVTYWSRKRGRWRKGETSGNTQRLIEAWIDCDGDVLLLKVDQMGPACHTGAPSCFFRRLGP